METIQVKSSSHEQIIDISHEVQRVVRDSLVQSGICLIYTPHTTASITINENADPTVKRDILHGLKHLKIESCSFEHMEGNSPGHIKSSLFGCSEMVIIDNSELQLGTWQGIFFCEFDGPRNRKVLIQIIEK